MTSRFTWKPGDIEIEEKSITKKVTLVDIIKGGPGSGPHPGEARLGELRDQIKGLMSKNGGNLNAADREKFQAATHEYNSLKYDVGIKPLDQEKIKTPEERQSTLSKDTIVAANKDLISNKEVYVALSDAASGVQFNANTGVDDIMEGKGPISAEKFYDTFAGTREALTKQYGDKMTLYRAPGSQKDKATTNWATTKAFAANFGPRVISKEIPVKNIIAVNVGPSGNYHEMVVGNPPR